MAACLIFLQKKKTRKYFLWKLHFHLLEGSPLPDTLGQAVILMLTMTDHGGKN